MIQHIVLLKFKPETTEQQIQDAFGGAQALVDEIDGVQRVTLGRNRGDDDHGYTHALIVRLDSEDQLAEYLAHPVRRAYVSETLAPLETERIEIDVPEDAHVGRRSRRAGWDWTGTRPSASAAAAALRWEEQHPDE